MKRTLTVLLIWWYRICHDGIQASSDSRHLARTAGLRRSTSTGIAPYGLPALTIGRFPGDRSHFDAVSFGYDYLQRLPAGSPERKADRNQQLLPVYELTGSDSRCSRCCS
jgi:hypothetical protein